MQDREKKLLGASVIYLTDASRVETDDTCGMKYWFSKLEGGQGIVNRDEVVPIMLDNAIHNDLRTLSKMPNIGSHLIQERIDEVLKGLSYEDRQDVVKMELLYRRLGWFAAFALFIEPEIRQVYDSIPIDESIVLDKDPLWVVAYPDRLLRDKLTKEITYREYVPMAAGLTHKKWLDSWKYNIRLHVGIAAGIEAASDPTLAPSAGQVMGMAMGFHSLLNRKLVHPYVWAWKNRYTSEWSTTSPTPNVDAWEPTPVWNYKGGIVQWVRYCGPEVARGQFPLSPYVYLNREMLDEWSAARLHREREISGIKVTAQMNPHIRSVYFRKVTNQCYPTNSDMCPFVHACWDKTHKHMPLKSGIYLPNIPSEMGGIES